MDWLKVYDAGDGETYVARVPGGAILRHCYSGLEDSVAVTMTFIGMSSEKFDKWIKSMELPK